MIRTATALALFFVAACATTEDQGAPQTAAPIVTPNEVAAVSPTIKGVRYVMSSVSDIDRTISFYQQAVDFEVYKRYQIDSGQFDPVLLSGTSGPAEVAIIKTPTVYLKLIDFDLESDEPGTPGSITGPGYTHVCYQSKTDNSAYAKFDSAGLSMITRGDGPADRGYGTAYAYGTDLDGIMIEMEVQERTRRDDDAWIGHVANATPDLERMLAFYELLLGYAAHNRAEISGSAWADSVGDIDGLVMKGGWSMVANLGLEFWQFDAPRTIERSAPATLDSIGYAYLAFEVGDLAAEITRLEQIGVKFAGDPIEEEGWKMAFGYDPDGTLFSLQENVSADPAESIDDLLWLDRSAL
nr:VOC family protein [Hyphomonas sp. Mor2]